MYPANWTGDDTEDKAGYISLEKSEVYAATARGALELAGLGDVVKVSCEGAGSIIQAMKCDSDTFVCLTRL